ncbi:MAG: DUF421 domain-containing protein [Clostridiales bacterium]|nr:DUF421 domain-containing protein [Clostridiales bacterium]
MLVIFLRASLLYLFILFILRLTGKREVSSLQPFDLLITLTIADIASTAIADVNMPLLYSIVPILAIFLVQRAMAYLGMKSGRVRLALCGSPLILVRDGVLQESTMRQANYTVADLTEHLRERDIFDLGQVAFAILETNGSLSVMQHGQYQQPTLADLSLPSDKAALSHMLILDGRLCRHALRNLNLSERYVRDQLKAMHVKRIADVFFLQLSPDGSLRLQLQAQLGGGLRVTPPHQVPGSPTNQRFVGVGCGLGGDPGPAMTETQTETGA